MVKMRELLLICTVLAVSLSASASLVGQWNFDGPAGSTVAQDLVGNNDATIIGTTMDGSGKVTLAGGNDDDTGQYIDLGASTGDLIHSLDSFTMVITMDWDGAAGGTYQKVWNFDQGGTSEFSTLTFVSSNEAYLRYQHRYAAHDDKSNAGTPDLKGKHQIAVRYDASIGEYGQVKIFVDGLYEGGHTCDCDNSPAISGPTPNNWIGRSAYDNANYLDGAVYDFSIYDNALTDTQIAQLVPEPATMLMLGLGGVFLRRRRK